MFIKGFHCRISESPSILSLVFTTRARAKITHTNNLRRPRCDGLWAAAAFGGRRGRRRRSISATAFFWFFLCECSITSFIPLFLCESSHDDECWEETLVCTTTTVLIKVVFLLFPPAQPRLKAALSMALCHHHHHTRQLRKRCFRGHTIKKKDTKVDGVLFKQSVCFSKTFLENDLWKVCSDCAWPQSEPVILKVWPISMSGLRHLSTTVGKFE